MFTTRVVSLLALSLAVATPALAQLQGMPVYFSPKGGTGITINGDFGRVSGEKQDGNAVAVHPTAIGARVYLGLPFITLGAGIANFDPKITNLDSETQYMGSAAFRLFGSPLVPIAVSLQVGAGYLKRGDGAGATKTVSVPIGLGAALNIPTPGASLEPWVAGRVQVKSSTSGTGATSASQTKTGFGVSGGLSMGLPIGLGLHAAVDWSRYGPKPASLVTRERPETETFTVGIGAHFMIRLPGVPLIPGV